VLLALIILFHGQELAVENVLHRMTIAMNLHWVLCLAGTDFAGRDPHTVDVASTRRTLTQPRTGHAELWPM
jgi:hypothetical protein